MQDSVEPRNVRDQKSLVEYDIEDILSQIDGFAKEHQNGTVTIEFKIYRLLT